MSREQLVEATKAFEDPAYVPPGKVSPKLVAAEKRVRAAIRKERRGGAAQSWARGRSASRRRSSGGC